MHSLRNTHECSQEKHPSRREVLLLLSGMAAAVFPVEAHAHPLSCSEATPTKHQLIERLCDNTRAGILAEDIPNGVPLWRRRFLGLDEEYGVNLDSIDGVPGYLQMRHNLEKGLIRILEEDHLAYIYKACCTKGLPFEVTWLALAESFWQTGITSRSGAVGAWQITKGTAQDLGLSVHSPDQRTDPKKSTNAALTYLKQRFNEAPSWTNKTLTVNQKWLMAMMAYHQGAGRVRKKIREAHSFEDMMSRMWRNRRASPDSAHYVARIFGLREAVMHLYENHLYPFDTNAFGAYDGA